MPPVWAVLRDKFYIDELYGATVIAFYGWWAKVADWIDRDIWGEWLRPWRSCSARWARLESVPRCEHR